MPYYPSIVIFPAQASMVDVEKALLAELGAEFELSFEPPRATRDKATAGEFLRRQEDGVSRFGISRPPHHVVFSGPLPSGNLEMRIWDSDRNGSGDVSDSARAEWRMLALKLHRILVKDVKALLSYTSVYDHHYSGSPDAYDIGDFVGRELKAKGAAGLQYVLQNPFFFWILGINKQAFGDDLEGCCAGLARYFHAVEESADFLVLENKEDTPVFLQR